MKSLETGQRASGEETPTPQNKEDEDIKRRVLEDMKEIGRGENPEVRDDWDLVWVLSGPPIDIREDFTDGTKEALFPKEDRETETVRNDVANKRNESRERLGTGIKVAKEVCALRLKKNVGNLTLGEILQYAPAIYWNATDWANNNIREATGEGFFEKTYNFPREKVIVSPNLGIINTDDQFKKFPGEFTEENRKIVIISDIYHLPRVKRFLHRKNSKVTEQNAVLYPSEPRAVPFRKVREEIRKIPQYIDKGILPPE
jgi:hypothetical protein